MSIIRLTLLNEEYEEIHTNSVIALREFNLSSVIDLTADPPIIDTDFLNDLANAIVEATY